MTFPRGFSLVASLHFAGIKVAPSKWQITFKVNQSIPAFLTRAIGTKAVLGHTEYIRIFNKDIHCRRLHRLQPCI
jgi:hypothetical protein